MEMVNKKLIIIAVILSIFTSLFIYSYINRLTKSNQITEFVKVYVAAKTIQARTKILASDIKEVEIEEKFVLPGTFLNKAEFIGKRVKESILSGEQILKDRIVSEKKANLSYSIPEGKRAMSINVNEASEVANFPRPGDYVDIIATFEKEEVIEQTRKVIYPKISRTVLQNILVLGIGQDSYIPEDDKKRELPKTVTLAVDAVDIEKLVYSSEVGVIRLALRRVGDTKKIETSGKIRNELTGEKGVIILTK